MTIPIDLKLALFQTNKALIAKKNGEECHAFLYHDDKKVFVATGMQAELIYWFSQRFTPHRYQSIFSYINDIYDISPTELHRDLEIVLRKLADLDLITISYQAE